MSKTILTVTWDDGTIETVLEALSAYEGPARGKALQARDDIENAERHYARTGMPEFRDGSPEPGRHAR